MENWACQPSLSRYDNPNYAAATLQGHSGTRFRNVAAGVAPTDAANVSQIEEAITSAKTYTDLRSIDTLNQANAYTDLRVAGLNARINYALAAATANRRAAAVAGQAQRTTTVLRCRMGSLPA